MEEVISLIIFARACMGASKVSFDDTKIAFASKTDGDLNRAYLLFKVISYSWLVRIAPGFMHTALALRLPVKGLIRATAFRHFCGGETIEGCEKTILELARYGIGTILDYSVEGKETEKDFENSLQHTLAGIARAKGDKKIPFSVFKLTGFARLALLERVNTTLTDRFGPSQDPLTAQEEAEFAKVRERVAKICAAANEVSVPVFIDAEKTWIQDVVDMLATEMMMKYNKEKVLIYNTVQLYRNDRLAYIKECLNHAQANRYLLGLKLVRGAYMEKERERAEQMNYPSPIQPDKQSSDNDYNEAIKLCVENLAMVSICAGTHNEESSLLLADLMAEKNIPNNHPHIWFSQLYGMSDHISFNLSVKGYNVSKYVPYGPVTSVLPYLIRRAQENTSVAGQTSRELALILR
jgi:proline dehydrogenase